jgi:cell division protein FtsB
MRLSRLAIYFVMGFVFASVLQFLFGSGGILEYRASSGYRGQLERNIEELKRINLQLLQELDGLRSDPELLRLQARQLGYFRANEHVIRIEGTPPPKNFYTIGKIILRKPLAPNSPWVFRLAGLGLPAVLLIRRTIVLLRRRKGDARPG